MKGDKSLLEELAVLCLDGDAEAVDDGAEDLQEFADAVERDLLVDEAVELVRDGCADERTAGPVARVDAVEDGLEGVALAVVFGVEEVDEEADEVDRDEVDGCFRIHLVRQHKAEEDLVHILKMSPHGVIERLFFFRIRCYRERTSAKKRMERER